MYVMADIRESVPNSVKPKPCHDKNRIYNGKINKLDLYFSFLSVCMLSWCMVVMMWWLVWSSIVKLLHPGSSFVLNMTTFSAPKPNAAVSE